MIPTFISTDLQKVKEQLQEVRQIAIIGHVSPDGDAVGSTLAMSRILRHQGHHTTVIYPTFYAASFNCLSGSDETIIAKEDMAAAERALRAADLIICMDFNEPRRAERLMDVLVDTRAFKLLIDHHLHPSDFADVIFSYPKISSTCLLLYHLIQALEWNPFMDKEIAECIYMGMMTDTGGFSYNSEDPAIYTTISDLLRYGLEKDYLTSLVTRSYSVDKIRLNAHAVLNKMTVIPEYKTAIITMTHKEKRHYNYQVGDTEGLVNVPLEAKEILFSIFIYEVEDYTKISFRSKDEFACNVFAKTYFNGGGHHNASGAESATTIEETYDQVLEALKEMHP